jgi:hypothetical protein
VNGLQPAHHAALAAAALLAACGQASPPAQEFAPATLAVPAAVRAEQRPTRRASWMSPSAATAKALLYVSDAGTFEVAVYTFPALKLTGTLTGFSRPQGECTDNTGNVWITNTIQLDILEFAHGGTRAIANLADPTGYPVGCAIDAGTGDLAVTNIYDLSGGGGIVVYKRARGTPRVYTNQTQKFCYFAAYDSKGNLYVSGSTKGGAYVLTRLERGGSALTRLTVGGATIHYPGTVAWVGSTLVLGDQKCNGGDSSCLYAASVSGTAVQITGTIPLKKACDVAQAWIGNGRIAGGDYEYCSGGRRSGVELWPYPAGGIPSARVTGLETPVGATVSFK